MRLKPLQIRIQHSPRIHIGRILLPRRDHLRFDHRILHTKERDNRYVGQTKAVAHNKLAVADPAVEIGEAAFDLPQLTLRPFGAGSRRCIKNTIPIPLFFLVM